MVSVTHEEAKIIIADDHELTRESIRKMLESEPHLQVLAEAKDGQEVIELCRLHRPDLVLMDVGMPKVNGFEATRIIKAELPTTKVLMLSAHFDSFFASEVERAGADGYVTKLCTVQELGGHCASRENSKKGWRFCDATYTCLLYTSPSPRDRQKSRMPSSA